MVVFFDIPFIWGYMMNKKLCHSLFKTANNNDPKIMKFALPSGNKKPSENINKYFYNDISSNKKNKSIIIKNKSFNFNIFFYRFLSMLLFVCFIYFLLKEGKLSVNSISCLLLCIILPHFPYLKKLKLPFFETEYYPNSELYNN